MAPDLPFPRSYWVSPGKLLAGYYPGDIDEGVARHKLRSLVATGITQMISLMEPEEVDNIGRPFIVYRAVLQKIATDSGKAVAFRRFGIQDMGVPTVTAMVEILKAIDEEATRGGCTYVHCWGGKGRTGTVVGCWLMRHGHVTPDTVLQHLVHLTAHNRAAFPAIPQTDEQRRFVRSWPARA